MSAHPSFDRDSFQNLLANAYAVQQSGLDVASLTALAELQRLLAAGVPNSDAAMQLVADRARRVANAAGVAIGLLEADHLVYRAGSGRAAVFAGRKMTAVLGASGANRNRGEILRVENAGIDTRIEADVCRQFDAESLLMLPIYRGQAVAGMLQVLFDEPHAFPEREVRAYRLMATLVEETAFRSAEAEKEVFQPVIVEGEAKPVFARAHESSSEAARPFLVSDDRSAIPFQTGWEAPTLWEPVRMVNNLLNQFKHLRLHRVRLNVALAAMALLVLATGWIIVGRRSTPRAAAATQSSPAVEQQAASPVPVSVPPGISAAPRAAPTFRRVRVGPNEVDDVADDVTVRYFATKPAAKTLPRPDAYRQVNLGRDVTVRYFPPRAAMVSQTRIDPTPTPPVTRPSTLLK